jgi:hypothetical protein
MTSLVGLINSVMVLLSGWFVSPFRGVHPIWPIAAISLITAVLMLWVFGKLSNQKAIRTVRQRIRGNLLAVRLYQHDVKTILHLQWRIFVDTFIYLRYSLGPFLVMVVPIVLVLAQIQLYFSVKPVEVNQSVVVKAVLKDPSVLTNANASLTVDNQSVEIETPPVRSMEEGEVAWRIKGLQPGRHRLVFQFGGSELEKELVVGDGWTRVPFLRTSSALDAFLYPGEDLITAAQPFSELEVDYSALPILILGWDFHWLLLFFLLSLIFALILRRPMGVEI